jgi:hypothetical protein
MEVRNERTTKGLRKKLQPAQPIQLNRLGSGVSGKDGLSRCARVGVVFASKARYGQGPAAARVVRWGAVMGCVAMRCVAMRCGWVAFRSAPTGHGIPAQGETLGARHTQPMRSEGTPHRSVGQAFEGCVSGAGSAGSCPPRAQDALGRMGFRAARGWVWCSPPRRATAKVPLRPGWCDGVCCNEVWLGGFPECPNGARHTSPG